VPWPGDGVKLLHTCAMSCTPAGLGIKQQSTPLGAGGTESGSCGGEPWKPGGGGNIPCAGDGPALTNGILAVSTRRTSAKAAAASLPVIVQLSGVQRAAFQIEQPRAAAALGLGERTFFSY
jgi:hypothetical protein